MITEPYAEQEKYCGPITCFCFIAACILLGPVGVLVACCPCDKRVIQWRDGVPYRNGAPVVSMFS
jgi:hypothetical protein